MRSADWERRLDAVTPTRSFVVQAPAGSGKTELLTARYLALLAGGGAGGGPCRPGQILAVTYTDKAATEMKRRIAHWLQQAAAGYTPPEGSDWERVVLGHAQRALQAHADNPALLQNPTAYRVGTFHSFCSSVCRAWPMASGIPIGSEILPEHQQKLFLAQAIQDLLAGFLRKSPEDPIRQAMERRLVALNNSPRRLSSQLVAILADRHKLWQFANAVGPGAPCAEEALSLFFGDFIAPLVECFREPGVYGEVLDPVADSASADGVPAEPPGDQLEDIPGWKAVAQAVLTTGRTLRAACERALPRGTDAALVEERLGLFYELNTSPQSYGPDALALEDYLNLSRAALECLAPLIPGRGLDYLELELGARRALENTEGVPSEGLVFFHEHLRHILVDEAQDMNRTQLDLLGFLTEGWEPEEADHPRTVFVVGDPKQSIYRFRRAEVALFENLAAEGIRRDGSEGAFRFASTITLESNFRSSPGLVAFSNEIFDEIMADPDSSQDEVPFSPGRAEKSGTPYLPEVRLAVFLDEKTEKKAAKKGQVAPPAAEPPPAAAEAALGREQREAQWVAGQIARLRTLRPDDTIGLLLPKRTRLDAYVVALREAGVAVRMVEGEDLATKPEIAHLHNLFKALARPYDDVAWAGTLRAPWGRVGERALYGLAASGGPPGSWKERIVASTFPDIQRVWRALAPAAADFGREPYAATLRRAWEAMGGPAAVASRYKTQGVANCLAYFELLEECGAAPPEEAVALVEMRFEQKIYTPPDPAAASSPVQLMTIHKAKGLEFDHVFVAYLGYSPGKGNKREQPPFVLLDLPNSQGVRVPCAATERDSRLAERSLPHSLLVAADRMRERAEIKRLLYVAVTRAKTSLTLSGCARFEKEALQYPKNSPLELLADAIVLSGGMSPMALNPPPEGAVAIPSAATTASATARIVPPLAAFALPYITKSPSEKLDAEEDQAKAGGEDEKDAGDDGSAAIIGKVVHRLLETLARQKGPGALPTATSVAAALRSEGLATLEAERLAPKLLAEARGAWDDAGFAALRQGGELKPEWALETLKPSDGAPSPTIYSGRLDLVIVKQGEVIVVDYKTGRRPKDKTPEQFRAEMVEHYNHQLASYQKMLAALPGVAGKAFRSCLLLTDLPAERLVL